MEQALLVRRNWYTYGATDPIDPVTGANRSFDQTGKPDVSRNSLKRSHDDLSFDFDFDLGFGLDFSRKEVEFQLNSDLNLPNEVGVDSDH